MPYPSKLSSEQILDSAEVLLESQGPEALTMRSLAEALQVRPSSLYRHFQSRETLLRALGDRATLALHNELRQATQGQEARPALLCAVTTYLNYARTHPHLYALMLVENDDLTPQELAESPGKQLWNTFLELIGAVSGHPDDTDHTVAFWTFLHGFVSLERTGAFGKSGPRGGLTVGVEALIGYMENAAKQSVRQS
ncbi:TetR/AcrR family transcriptional regulator [Deinococcus taklimakanensis]|uniref:TetR/AcrR family transcriptional regulator n=1 Tax=Deinococcus taklimakanensis TaxID=536443 RepID=A0ABW5P8W2_9DEIO